MPSIIKYVIGVPDDKNVEATCFDELGEELNLEVEEPAVFLYSGALSQDDFEGLFLVLNSPEYKNIAEITEAVRKDFLALVKDDKFDSTYRREQRSAVLKMVSRHFHRLIKQALSQQKMSHDEVVGYVFDEAKKKGEYSPISFCCSVDGMKSISPDKKTLVFVDDELSGDVTLKNTTRYHDTMAGGTVIGQAVVRVKEQIENVGWNHWEFGFLGKKIDPIIRDNILKENNAGIIFHIQ